jgi:homoserine dehydrogenase
MDMNSSLDRAEQPLCVLKFGSSVLAGEGDYRTAAQEIYRHIRAGEKIVAVVSALHGETDQLLAQAARVGGDPADSFVARLVRIGELRSAALLGLALERMGVRAATLDPHEAGLRARGEALDADLIDLDVAAVEERLACHDVIVVPGFIATHPEHGVVTLGRGGTDLSAVFLAGRLGSRRVRLLKDVDGVYHEDPVKNPQAERYGTLGYDAAAAASTGLIQPKAIDAAKAENIVIEVAAIAHHEATVIGDLPARREVPRPFRRLKVALLGCGDVGAGVLSYLKERPDLFDLNPVLVRSPARHFGIFDHDFTASLDDALGGGVDLVIELIGGIEPAGAIMRDALARGTHVVTANKAALAARHEALQAASRAGGGLLFHAAAVGGGAPILETIDRLGGTPIAAVEGVMNGTCNFLLSKLEEGWTFDDALARAQALGFAEADPAMDVDGGDAADKLSLIVRAAFGTALPPEAIARESLRLISPGAAQAAVAQGQRLKQVGRCRRLSDGSLQTEVRIAALPHDHPLAGARNEENRFRITTANGAVHDVYGKGAGRWPTAAAVFADVMDLQRRLAGAGTDTLQEVMPLAPRAGAVA